MVILGFDTGAHLGWCRGESFRGVGKEIQVRHLESGVIEGDPDDVIREAMAMIQGRPPHAIGIEKVIGGGYSGEGKGSAQVSGALVATNWQGGTLNGIAIASGFRPVEMPARKWRGMVCGKPSAKSGEIKAALETLLVDMPKRSNNHTRDAMGVVMGVALTVGL